MVYEINLCSWAQVADFMIGDSLFGAAKLTKNTTDFGKHKYFGYIVGFDAHEVACYLMVVGLVKT